MSILTVTEAAKRRRQGNQDAGGGGGGGDAGGGFITLRTAMRSSTRPSARLANDRFVYLPYYVILCLRSSDASAADVGCWPVVIVLKRRNGPRRLRDHDNY